MSWWSLFKQEIDVEVIKRQLAQCLSAIIQHPAVAEDFEDCGRLAGSPAEQAQQLLDFVGDRMWDSDFAHRMQQALNRNELKMILRTDLTTTTSPTPPFPSGSMIQDRPTNPRWTDSDEQERQTRELRKIAEWLSPLNFKASQIDHLQKREPGTGEWFLESQGFKDWRDGPPAMLWCPGSPGAGKTVLAATIIEHLQTVYKHDNAAITWIYCDYKDRAEQTIVNLVGSLLKQVVQKKSSVSKNVKELYERHQIDETRPALGELERMITSEFTIYSNAFVVVDAVDECPEDTGTQSELLRVLQTFSTTLKVLVTSRDVPTIGLWFGSEKVIRIEARDEDVRRYIQGRIDRKRKRHLKILESKIADKVSEKAEGMFLLVRLLMDSIVGKVNSVGVHKVLEDMPKGMDGIYADALQRIREQDEEQAQLGEQVLKWVTFAFRPLSVEELQDALAVVWKTTSLDRGAIIDEEIMTSACAGLVVVDKGVKGTSRRVRLIHYTTQSYFDRMRTIHFPGAHIEIAKTCITYLSQDALVGVELASYGAMWDLMERYCLLRYASDSWGDHIREQSDEECGEMVHRFLEDERTYLLPGQILNRNVYPKVVGFTGIHLSSFFGLDHIIEEQLLNGANPHQRDNQGQTPLALAAARGHEKVMKLLFAQPDVDVNVTDKDGQTSLLRAAKNGHVSVAKLLLEQHNVDINLMDEEYQTPLSVASKNGHVKVVELLLKQSNIDINMTDKNGMTPLSMAAQHGYVKVVELLLKQPKLDTNLTDDYGQTHLMLAAQGQNAQVVELLLAETYVNINLTDENGKTLLSHAAVGGNEKVVELLLAQPNIDINSTDNDGLMPLFRAAENGHVKVVELLLKQPNITMNLTKETWVAKEGHAKVVKLLLDQLNLEVHLKHDLTILYLAAENGHEKLVEFLLTQPNVAINNIQIPSSSTSVNVPHKKLDVSVACTLEHESHVLCVCFSTDGNYIATACNDIVGIHDTRTGEKICNLVDKNTLSSSTDAYVCSLCFSPDGKYLATGTTDALIRVWDIAGESIWRIFEGSVESVDFSRDGRFIVSGSWDGTACVWDMETGKHKELLTESEKYIGVWSVAISPEGLLVATASDDVIQLWDIQSGALIERLYHNYAVSSVAFTPDGKGLLSAGGIRDRTVKHWDLSPLLCNPWRFVPLSEPYRDDRSERETSEKGSVCTATFRGHKAPVSSVAVSQDGQWVVSGSQDGSVRFWDLHTRQAELVLWGHEGEGAFLRI